MTESPNPDHQTAAQVVVSTDGSAPAEQQVLAEDGKKPAGIGLYLELLGERSVPVVLIALGLSIVAADDEIEVTRIPGWGEPQYVGMLAFAALLVLLGCIERIVQLRSPRAPLIEPPQRRTNSRRRRDRRKAA
jgi:hypothetical protein